MYVVVCTSPPRGIIDSAYVNIDTGKLLSIGVLVEFREVLEY